jgi:hypothetical protein
VAAAIALLGVAQLALPGIAAQRLRDRLARSGQVLQVEVDAFPAIELLWDQADHVTVRLGTYAPQPGHLFSLLGELGQVGTVDASASQLRSGPLILEHARLSKRGDRVTGSATITEANLRAAVPFLQSVVPIASAAGQLTLQGTASAFGLSATLDATLAARNGDLVVSPNVPFGGLATVTVFASPALAVQSVSAAPAPGGFALTAYARLR